MNSLWKALRWALVLPVALAAFMVIGLAMHVLIRVLPNNPMHVMGTKVDPMALLTGTVQAGGETFAFVTAGTLVAPNRRVLAALVLAVLCGIPMGWSAVTSRNSGGLRSGNSGG